MASDCGAAVYEARLLQGVWPCPCQMCSSDSAVKSCWACRRCPWSLWSTVPWCRVFDGGLRSFTRRSNHEEVLHPTFFLVARKTNHEEGGVGFCLCRSVTNNVPESASELVSLRSSWSETFQRECSKWHWLPLNRREGRDKFGVSGPFGLAC